MANERNKQQTKDPEQQRQRKEEKTRAARRRNRQIIGFALSILIIVGAASIIRGGVNLVRNMVNSEDERMEYQAKFEPMVWFDILPFDDISTVDENQIKEVCIWGVLTKLGDTIGRNEMGEPIVPAAEVDLYGMELFGPDFRFTVHDSFVNTLFDLRYIYDTETQSYAAPNTGLMPPYLASVVEIQREKAGVRRVVMGYISTRTADDQVIAVPDYDNPARYMDYMLRRDGNQYYLYAIKPNTTHTPKTDSGAELTDGNENALAALEPDPIDPDDIPPPLDIDSSEPVPASLPEDDDGTDEGADGGEEDGDSSDEDSSAEE